MTEFTNEELQTLRYALMSRSRECEQNRDTFSKIPSSVEHWESERKKALTLWHKVHAISNREFPPALRTPQPSAPYLGD